MISTNYCIFETFQEMIYIDEDFDKEIIHMRPVVQEFHF